MSALLTGRRPGGRLASRSPADTARLDWLIVASLVVVYGALQAAFVRPPFLSDQLHYFLDASTLPAITEPPHQSLRIGLVIPVWLAIKVFGYSEAAYYALPYLSSAGLVVVTYCLGRLLADRLTGAVAGLLVVANPFVLAESSDLLPDIPAATLFTVAIVLMLWQRRRAGEGRGLETADRVLLVTIGILLGWSYLVREFILSWYPAVAVVGTGLRYPASWWRRIAVGAAATLSLELIWGLVVHGDPFARVRAALNQPPPPPWRVAEVRELIASGEVPDTQIDLLLALPRAVVASPAGWITVALLVALVVATIVVSGQSLRLLAAWVGIPLGLLLAVILVTDAFDARILRPEKVRYWLPLLPPLVVGGAIGLRELGSRLWGAAGRVAAQALLVVAVLASVLLTGAELDQRAAFTRTGSGYLLEFREWAASKGQTCAVLWADDDHWRATTRWLPMYLRSFWGRPVWRGEVRPLNSGDEFVGLSALESGALIRSRISIERRRQEEQPLPAYLVEPPQSWPVLLETAQDHIRVLGVGPSTCARP